MKSSEFSICSGSDMIGSAGGQLNLPYSTGGGLQGQAWLYSVPASFSEVLGKGKDSTLQGFRRRGFSHRLLMHACTFGMGISL